MEVLNWLISITSASFFINWSIIAFTSFRFRAAIKAQKMPIFEQQYGWRSTFWPLAPIVILIISAILLVCLIYASCAPLVSSPSFVHFPTPLIARTGWRRFYSLQLLLVYYRFTCYCRVHVGIQDHTTHKMAGSDDGGFGDWSPRVDNRRDSAIGCLFQSANMEETG